MRPLAGSLFTRTALTLAAAFVVFQAAATWVVFRTVVMPVAARSADDLAGLTPKWEAAATKLAALDAEA